MRSLYLFLLTCAVYLATTISLFAANGQPTDKSTGSNVFYVIKLHKDIDKSALRTITKGLEQAEANDADYCIIDINTYGGAVDAADSIRNAILRAPMPVISFINIQAASAGALISIACDSIYMNAGSSIGAATVVNGSGEVMPDKYQSFMRAMMRSTAESHGKVYEVDSDGDTVLVWRRNPKIAQAMVSKDSVLSYTPSEAIENGYCEGMAGSVEEVISAIVLGNYSDNGGEDVKPEVIYQTESILDKMINFLLSPMLQGLLLMLIIGGIYFEMQSPGIGFPLVAALAGAVLYFAPLYLEGLVQNWEIALFIAGIVLLAVEVFVIPGFGVAGVSGIICMVTGLAFAMVDNDLLIVEGSFDIKPVLKPLAVVLVSMTVSLFGSIYLAAKLYGTRAFSRIALKTDLTAEEGFVGVEKDSLQHLVGLHGVVATDLKPSGTVEIEGKRYYAQINCGFAPKGSEVVVIKAEEGRLFCKRS